MIRRRHCKAAGAAAGHKREEALTANAQALENMVQDLREQHSLSGQADNPILDFKFQGSNVAYTLYVGDSVAVPMGYVYTEVEDLPDVKTSQDLPGQEV